MTGLRAPVIASVLASALLANAGAALAQEANPIAKATAVEGNCAGLNDAFLPALTDGDIRTGWGGPASTLCEITLRFDDRITASGLIIATMNPDDGPKNTANLVTVWGSHQSFGNVFFRIGQANLAGRENGLAAIDFGDRMNLHSLKILMEKTGGGTWPRDTGNRYVQIMDMALTGTKGETRVSRWPQKPLEPLKGPSDPIVESEATGCDMLAGIPFNPDSYGYGRSNDDIDVPEALAECQVAVARFPDSIRLATNTARVELLAERAPQAIARLTSPMLAGYAPAQHLLAESFEKGRGVQKDEARAAELYGKSAAQDFGPALNWVAADIEKKASEAVAAEGQASNDATVEPNLQRAVELGYLPAMSTYFNHAMRYNLAPVEELYRLLEDAAEQGDQLPMGSFATNLHNGYKIDRRQADSLYYNLRLSHLNLHASMTNYSRRDSAANWQYWRKRAAYSGQYYTLEHFARMLEQGEKRTQIARLAFESGLEEAEGGDGWAMEWVAQYYDQGFGVTEDPVQSRAWRCKARAVNNPVALTTMLPIIPGQLYNGSC